MSKDIDVSVQEVTTALTKTIEAAGELVRCALRAWQVIGEARGNSVTYSPTYGFNVDESEFAAALKEQTEASTNYARWRARS